MQHPPLPPKFLVEDWEIDELGPFPESTKLPFSGFVDVEGRVHFEVNHWAYVRGNKIWDNLYWVFNPDHYLKNLCTRITDESLLKNERQLLGGLTGVFYHKEKYALIYYLGLLPKGRGVPVGHEERQRAFVNITHQLDRFLVWLGTERVETTPCFIEKTKMAKIGWKIKKLSLKDHLKMLHDGLPISLRKRPRIYEKFYGDAQLDFGDGTINNREARGLRLCINQQPKQ